MKRRECGTCWPRSCSPNRAAWTNRCCIAEARAAVNRLIADIAGAADPRWTSPLGHIDSLIAVYEAHAIDAAGIAWLHELARTNRNLQANANFMLARIRYLQGAVAEAPRLLEPALPGGGRGEGWVDLCADGNVTLALVRLTLEGQTDAARSLVGQCPGLWHSAAWPTPAASCIYLGEGRAFADGILRPLRRAGIGGLSQGAVEYRHAPRRSLCARAKPAC